MATETPEQPATAGLGVTRTESAGQPPTEAPGPPPAELPFDSASAAGSPQA